jgi:hypothetical protein
MYADKILSKASRTLDFCSKRQSWSPKPMLSRTVTDYSVLQTESIQIYDFINTMI